MMLNRSALTLVLALAASPALAQSQPKVVVELFTSQGCASCPPADALLNDLAKDPQVLALTLSVDYWDYVGWKDTLALHGHSLRQKAYAEQRPDKKIYTPQMVIDGQIAAKGSDRAAVQRAVMTARASGGLSLPVEVKRDGDAIEITLPQPLAIQDGAELWACPVARTQSVSIGRGENGGRNVTYANVVRGWTRVARWQGDTRTFRVPLKDIHRDGMDAVAVMVQTGTPATPGQIVGATLFPLD
ncbi:DUF1223 domain-containing protein [Xanthobacter aminoxidans]|uniref:DUF1223 domain-containing protein n=1 Tax=Xanthobacter aminoxidans TaxID=186280 RepID=UPI00372A2566